VTPDMVKDDASAAGSPSASRLDMQSLGSMLQARWKSGGSSKSDKPQLLAVGQVRSFRVAKLDRAARKIELTLA